MSTTSKTPLRGHAAPEAVRDFRARRWLRRLGWLAAAALCLLFLFSAPLAAADSSISCNYAGLTPTGAEQPQQDVFPTRTTGVAHFYNFTDREYTLNIADKWLSLHKGSPYQPWESWVELPPGEYDYHAYALDGSVIYGSTRVFQTITWPAAIGEPYQEPPAPAPVGPYAPPSPDLGTLVFWNSSDKDMTLVLQDEAFPLHAASASGPYEVIKFVRPGNVDFRVLIPSESQILGCGEESDYLMQHGILFTRTVRPGQVTIWEAPK